MEVYIDDMLVKFKESLDHAGHLQEPFKGVWYEAQSLKVCLRSQYGSILGFHGDSEGYRS